MTFYRQRHGPGFSRRRALQRFSALNRDGWRCRKCGKAGRLEVDHIVPVSQGGPEWGIDAADISHVQTLCVGCHISKSAFEHSKPDPARESWAALVQNRLQETA